MKSQLRQSLEENTKEQPEITIDIKEHIEHYSDCDCKEIDFVTTKINPWAEAIVKLILNLHPALQALVILSIAFVFCFWIHST